MTTNQEASTTKVVRKPESSVSVCLSVCLSFSAHVFFGYSVERFKQGYKPYVQFKVRFLLYCIDFCAILHSEGL